MSPSGGNRGLFGFDSQNRAPFRLRGASDNGAASSSEVDLDSVTIVAQSEVRQGNVTDQSAHELAQLRNRAEKTKKSKRRTEAQYAQKETPR